MKITASRLREDVYNILDRILETGRPVEVVRNGKVLRIVPESPPPKPDRKRKPSRVMVGDPEDFVHIDWLHEWSEWK